MEQGLIKYEKTNEEFAFIKAISLGLIDIKEGNTMDLNEAKTKFGIVYSNAINDKYIVMRFVSH